MVGQIAPSMVRIVAEVLSEGTFRAVFESTRKRRSGESPTPLTLDTVGRAVLPAPVDELIATEENQIFKRTFEALPLREQEVLRLRYGLASYGREHSLRQVAQRLSIVPQRVHAIQARAEQRLAHMLAKDEEGHLSFE